MDDLSDNLATEDKTFPAQASMVYEGLKNGVFRVTIRFDEKWGRTCVRLYGHEGDDKSGYIDLMFNDKCLQGFLTSDPQR